MKGERFIETYAAIAQTNRERLRQLDGILTDFQSAGRDVLLLKGADLLSRAYGGVLGLRPMDDVDLLFHREDLPHLERILLARGFRPLIDGNPSYVGPDRILALDMISDIWYLTDIQAVWRRAVPRRVAGRIRPAMHPEDALIYLMAYQTIHRGRLSPQMALDLAALLDAEGQFIDWRSVVEQVAACHLEVPLYYGLAYARDTAGAKIPPWVLQAFEPLPSQRRTARLYHRLASGPGLPELGHFLLLFSRPGWNNKLRALWHTFFPSRDFLTWRYGRTNQRDHLWIRFSRPAYLVFKGGLLVFRICYRLLRTSKASLGLGHAKVIARAFELAGRALMYLAEGTTYLAAGTLRLQDLRGAIANAWEEFGRSEDVILSGLMDWESALYDRFLKPEDRILVVGCGTGRDLIALLKLGYRVEGLEVARRAVALARRMLEKEGLQAELYTGPIEAVALPGSFDVFTFSWFCYGYIPQADTRIGVLRKVKAHLNPGGRVLISYVLAERPPRSLTIGLTRFMARLTRSDWRPERGDVIGRAAGDRPAISYEHNFREGELEHEARAAGLTVVFHERRDVETAVLMV